MTLTASRKRLTTALRASSDDLLRYFLRRLDSEDAADALAEVMITAWTRVDALPEEPDEARMWLFGIARNVPLHAHRGNVRRSQLADRMRRVLSLRSARKHSHRNQSQIAAQRLVLPQPLRGLP